MEWSNLSIKILGIKFSNFTLDNSKCNKIGVKIIKRIHIDSLSKLWKCYYENFGT